MNEADTCRILITPALQQAGWGDPVWRMAVARAAFPSRSFCQKSER